MKSILQKAFSEVYDDEPKAVKKSGKIGKPKRKMMIAIALGKARRAGVNA